MFLMTVKANNKIRLDDEIISVKEGHKYIVPSHLGASFEGSPYFDFEEFINTKSITAPTDFTGKRILTIRTGGYGDLMFIARSLLEIKKNFKDTYIEFATAPRFSSLVKECFVPDIVDESSYILLPYPHYEKCDYFVSFEGFIEDNPEALQVNAFNLIASKKFFIDIGLDHTVPLKILSKYEDQAETISKTWDAPVIAMQVKASAIMRTYPYHYQNSLIKLLAQKGFKTLLLDRQPNIEMMFKKEIYDEEAQKSILTPYSMPFIPGSLGLSIALVKRCKLLVSPDSFFTYVGDSLGIPTIGIFSPISSMLRATGLNVYSLETVDGCYNCGKHGTSPCHWSQDTWSPCIKSILPEYVNYCVTEILSGNK